MSRFWTWYAEVNDDVRQKVIDEAWFGQKGQDNAMQQDVSVMGSEASMSTIGTAQIEPSDYGRELYGSNTTEQVEMSDLYGQDGADQEPPEQEM